MLFLALFLFLPCCKTKDELESLAKCEFRVKDVTDIYLAGVPIEGIEEFADLTYLEALQMVAAATAGELPLTLTLNVEIKNPNDRMAALNRTEWILYVDDIRMTDGVYDDRIEIPPHNGIAVMSVPVSANLVNILQGESGEALINLALNVADAGSEPSNITLSVKPDIRVGNRLISYPGYFDIKTEFTSGE